MIKEKKFRSSNLLLLIGFLILLIATMGIIQSVLKNNAGIEKSAYRYYIKEQPIVLPTLGDNIKVENENSEKVNADSENPSTEYMIIDPGSEYINSLIRPELSTPNIPTRILIPVIKLDAPVMVSDFYQTDVDGESFGQWQAPSQFAAGWHPDSALLGVVGNTVINGHHNVNGEVFGNLVDLEIGDLVYVYSGEKQFSYVIANRMILAERYMDAETRVNNARWLAKSEDERLTLVTCWPETSNTHRLILVARPYIED